MNKPVKKILRTSVSCILGVLVLVNLAIAGLQNRSGADYFENAPIALLQVSGGSMEPKFHSGDAILICPTPFSELKTGEIIVFCRGEQLITHEIIQKAEDLVYTQGTANPMPDDPVTEEEYRAKVICRIPGLGSIWRMYESAPMFLLWTVLLVLLLFGTDIFTAVYQLKERKKRE